MSLATRCTACGTVFRVVQDQLRVSTGWVRCGRCGEVFNAIESLVDLGVQWPDPGPPSAHASRVMDTLAGVAGVGADPPAAVAPQAASPSPVQDVTSPDLEPRPASAPHAGGGDIVEPGADDVGPGAQTGPATPPTDADRKDAVVDGDPPPQVVVTPDPPVAAAPGMAAPMPAPEPAPEWVDPNLQPDDAAPQAVPGFVRQVDRAARWRHPAVRALLALGCLLLTGTLGLQVHRSHHDWLAARWPALEPGVRWLCEQRACVIRPPRRIDALVVESSGLLRTGQPGIYRFALSLRNRSDTAARLPAIELALSDASGQPSARRVLSLAELGVHSEAIAAGAELGIAARLRVDAAPVVGYTIELFYP
jgi:predicted Zn finger-like uncharacterized protein